MEKLEENSMKKIYAGGFSTAGIVALIAAGISFFSGLFDGFTRPFRCR